MLQSQKNIFWEALIIAVFIFGIGVLLGIFIENGRVGQVSNMYTSSETNLLDIQVQAEMLNLINMSCENAINENIKFGNKVYEDAKTLERYEAANRITGSLNEQHKKYDTLRALFWVNSIKIKEKCGTQFHTLVYLYDYNSDDNAENSKQFVFSKFLEQLKELYGNKVILIPIARNLNITSIDLMQKNLGVNQTSVILDEKYIVSDMNQLYIIRDKIATQVYSPAQ